MSAAALRIFDLCVEAGGRRIVDGVGFTLEPGRVLGLVGESGSGKSITVLAALGLLPPGVARASSDISLLGHDPAAMPAAARRALLERRVGFVPQGPLSALDPLFTIGDQITARNRLHGSRRRPGAVWREAARGLVGGGAEATAMLAEVGLDQPERCQRQYPHELSGGMRRRCGRRRRWSSPTNPPRHSTRASSGRCSTCCWVEVRARGAALLLITHDLNVVSHYCDSAVVMRAAASWRPAASRRCFAPLARITRANCCARRRR